VKKAALVAVDPVCEATLQSLARVIQPLLRLADPVQQLARKRARTTVDLSLKVRDVGHDQFRRGTGRGRTQIRNEIADGEIDFVANGRDDWHRGMKYRSCDDFFIELP
jgi:hypothetical protein